MEKWSPDSAYLLGTPTLPLSHPAGGSGATETRSHKQIMEMAIRIDSMVFIVMSELFCIKHESLMVLKILQMEPLIFLFGLKLHPKLHFVQKV